MSCATPEQLAARDVDAEHVDSCLACRRALAEQQRVREQLSALRTPALTGERRAMLAAEVMARADLHDDTRVLPRRRGPIVVAGMALAAAAVAVLALRPEQRALSAPVAARTPIAVVQPPAPAPLPMPAPVPAVEPSVVKDVVPPPPAPKDEPASPGRVDRARQVFGATTDSQRAAIDRDTIALESPVAAFRIGWEALRAQRHDDAIAAFDRATDPAVAEDAAFWAAIAAQRAGYIDDARKRLDAFLTRFPDSPRAGDAREARRVLR